MQIILLLFILTLPVHAETILIKRSSGRKSKAILDKKFVFMKAGQEEAFSRSSDEDSGSSNQTRRVEHSSSKNINTLSKQLVKVPTVTKTKHKSPPSTSGRSNGSSGSGTGTIASNKAAPTVQQDIYDEDNWGDYAEYQAVELDESLNVNAKILNR